VKIAYGGRINYTLPGDGSIASCIASGLSLVQCATITAVLGDSSAKTEITMPPLLSVGLANRSIPRLTLELDLQWTGWSTFDQINIDFDNPNSPNSVKNKNWNDVLAIRFGGEYRLTDRFALRAGYVYDPTPVPGETVDTLLPDSDRHDVSIGLGITLKRIQADVAYLLVLFNDRNVNNQLDATTPLNPLATTSYNQSGKYETLVHLAGLSLTYRF
jgi:long-chain fatty acid transport protein